MTQLRKAVLTGCLLLFLRALALSHIDVPADDLAPGATLGTRRVRRPPTNLKFIRIHAVQ
jgi:hypothetical protein